jgi:hypothetical protein
MQNIPYLDGDLFMPDEQDAIERNAEHETG